MTTPSNTRVAEQIELSQFLASSKVLIDAELRRHLPLETAPPARVHAAMRWSVFAGGKRFRPALLIASGRVFSAPEESLLATSCALELIHTYSLIHDDLPSMDDDDLRRGQPTCHVRFDEATAILAGDALQSLAFQVISEDQRLSTEKRIRLINELARAAGTPSGMLAGQAFDLAAESSEVSAELLEQIHRLKTGALITFSARAGAIIADAEPDELKTISTYASQLGLLFQITDDLLDVTATAAALGKTPGKDVRASKATYPNVYGIDAARERASSVHRSACEALERLNRPVELLRQIADFILERNA